MAVCWNHVDLSYPCTYTLKQVGGFSYCFSIKIQRTSLSIWWLYSHFLLWIYDWRSYTYIGATAIMVSRACVKRQQNIFSAEARRSWLTLTWNISLQRAIVPFWLSVVPAKSSKSRYLTPSHCRDFMLRAWFVTIRGGNVAFHIAQLWQTLINIGSNQPRSANSGNMCS